MATRPTPPVIFLQAVLSWAPKLKADFAFSDQDAAAVLGNAGHESAGMTLMQEVKPTVAGSKGGLGAFQWTGPRRHAFEAWLARFGGRPDDLDLTYAFLFRELASSEKGAVTATRRAVGLDAKVRAFEAAYERARVKAYDRRLEWARQALDILRRQPPAPVSLPAPPRLEPVVVPPPGRHPLKLGQIIDFLFG